MNTNALSQKLVFLKDRVQLLNRLLVAQRDSLATHGITQPAESDLFETINTVRIGLNELAQLILDADREFRWQKALADLRVKLASGIPVETVVNGLLNDFGAKHSALIVRNFKNKFDAPELDVIAQQVIQQVASNGEAILTTNVQQDARYQNSQSIVGSQLTSIAAIPVKENNQVVGVLYLDRPVVKGLFSETDMELLKRVAGELSGFVNTPEKDMDARGGAGEAPADVLKRAEPPAKPVAPVTAPGTSKSAPPTVEIDIIAPELEYLGEEEDEPTEIIPRVAQPVEFSAYYPTEVTPVEWNPFYAYIFRQFAAPLVEADAKGELGNKLPLYRRSGHAVQRPVEEGTMITATPTLPGFQFNPPSITIGFYDDWQRFDFKMRAKDAALEQSVNGRLTFTALGLIIAEIPLSVFVTRKVRVLPLTAASPKPYSAVFCSYSHKDTPIVERVERALKSLGLDYLRDVNVLRSGQDWNDQLYNLIDNADIFQLFWSDAARKSTYVEREWRHALKNAERANFIRPVYWQKPIPTVPPELDHIHFAFQPELTE